MYAPFFMVIVVCRYTVRYQEHEATVSNAIEIEGLKFRWKQQTDWLIDIPQLTLEAGQKLFIEGPSGSGKSSLLSILAGIEKPHEGDVRLLGESLVSMSARARDRFRAEHIGYVFQQFNLLPYLTVMDNVRLAETFNGVSLTKQQGRERAAELLSGLAIPESLWLSPGNELSVGQQQRVAIARALYARPAIIIADEPTSALDDRNAAAFMQLLLRQIEQQKTTLVYVSHDESLRLNFDQVYSLKASRVSS